MQMFGREAAKLVDYVECFPEGYKKGTKMIKSCSDAGIEGFPTWVINGQVNNNFSCNIYISHQISYIVIYQLTVCVMYFSQVLSGEQEFSELAKASGFVNGDYTQPDG